MKMQATIGTGCAWLMASATATAAENPAAITGYGSVREMMEVGGWTMYVILAMSVIALFLALYYLFTLRAAVVYPEKLAQEMSRVAATGDLAGLRRLCEDSRTPLARVVESTVEQLQIDGCMDYAAIGAAMEDEGSRQANMLWQRIQYLLDVAVVAPMVGLLGTVLGMLQSFGNLQTEVSGVIPTAMAQGVAKALITTAGGLIVGIPAMLVYALLRGRVTAMIAGMEMASGRVLRRLCVAMRKTDLGK